MLCIARQPIGVVKPVADPANGIDNVLDHHVRASVAKACMAAAIRVPPVIQHMTA